ncbi:hypothetical protein OAL10_03905 [Gammaproteobacteria bacterium]|nr:hypothetical protein [Gammaproteobacteria bacterium]
MHALKALILVSLVFLVSCSPKELPIDLLVEMQGIKYEVNSDTPFTGISFENHDNGQIKERINYKDGEKEGLWESYHENGQLEYKLNYKDGKVHGLEEWYSEDGELSYKTCYDNGEKVDMSYCEK